jgi:hypothetical protein
MPRTKRCRERLYFFRGPTQDNGSATSLARENYRGLLTRRNLGGDQSDVINAN